MNWRTWVRATALRLGIAEPGSIPVEDALEALRSIEERLVALRGSLIVESAVRSLYVEEATAFDVARGNVYAATKVLRSELIRLGVPAQQLPLATVLAPLPASAIQDVRFAPTSGAALGGLGGGAFGAVRVGRGGVAPHVLAGGDGAGTLGYGQIVAIIGWGLLVIGIVGSVAGLTYVLVDLVNPEVAVQEAIAEHDVAIAEAMAATATAWEATRQAAIAAGIDPATLTPPDTSILAQLATGNPLAGGLSAVKGIIAGVAVLAAIFVGYKVWKSSRE